MMTGSAVSRVIREYDLAGVPELATGPMLTPIERLWGRVTTRSRETVGGPDAAAVALRSRLSIRRGERPLRFVVVVRGYDANFTALAANGLARTFVDDASPGVRERRDVVGWLEARLKAAKDVSASPTEAAPLTDRRRSLEVELRRALARTLRAEAAAEALTARAQSLRRAASSERLEGSEFEASPAVQSALRDLAETEARRANLEQSLGPRHPDVVAIRDRLFGERERLGKEIGQIVREAEVAADSSTRAAILEKDSVASLRAQLSGLSLGPPAAPARPAAPQLAEAPKRDLPAGAVHLDDPRAARLVSTALPPSRPYSPDLLLNQAIAAVAGLSFGLCLAFVRSAMEVTAASSGK